MLRDSIEQLYVGLVYNRGDELRTNSFIGLSHIIGLRKGSLTEKR